MRLVKISHTRCGDYDGEEYMLAPDDWDDQKIREITYEAQTELIEDAKKLKEGPEGKSYPTFVPYDQHPDKTVAEVQAMHAEAKQAYLEWKKDQDALKKSLSDRLHDKGFFRIWEDPDVKVRLDWGHNHGLDLNYEHSNF